MKKYEIIEHFGIRNKALLYYEKKGLICPQRQENGYRKYSQEDIKRIGKINKLRLHDIPVDTIKAYLNTGDERIIVEYISAKRTILQSQLDKLEKLADNINEEVCYDADLIDKIKLYIPGNFGQYVANQMKFYIEKDKIESNDNSRLIKEIINVLDNIEITEDLERMLDDHFSNEVVLLNNMQQETMYNYVINLRELPKVDENVMDALIDSNKPIKSELNKIGYYSKVIPLFRELCPSYDIYQTHIEFLETQYTGK